MEENSSIKTPNDKDKKGYYIVKKSRRNISDTGYDTYYSDDIWDGEKWLFATMFNSPILDVVGRIENESYNEVIKIIKEVNGEKEV